MLGLSLIKKVKQKNLNLMLLLSSTNDIIVMEVLKL